MHKISIIIAVLKNSDKQIQVIHRFGMANSINTYLRLKIGLIQHDPLTLNKYGNSQPTKSESNIF